MARPPLFPASPFLVNLTGQAFNTGTTSVQPFSAGQLAAALDNGDIFFRGTFQPTQDLSVTAAATYYLFKATHGGNEMSFRFDQPTQLFKVVVNGVTQQALSQLNLINMLAYSATGGQTDTAVFDFQWSPSLGRAGVRFHVGNSDDHGFDASTNNQYISSQSAVAAYGNAGAVVYNVGDMAVPVGGPVKGLRSRCTSGGFVPGGGLTPGPFVNRAGIPGVPPGIQYSTANAQGTSFTDSNGNIWETTDRDFASSAALPALTSFFLGSSDGTNNRFPAIWSQCGFMRRGSQIEPPTTFVVAVGDSQMTTWLNCVPVPARFRTSAELANPHPVFGMCAVPGQRLQFGFMKIMLLNSKWAALGRARLIKAWILQAGTNDIIGGRTAAQIIADMQDLVTNGVRAIDTTSPILLGQIPYERGALTAGQYTIWQTVNQAFAGGGATPVTDPVGSNIVYVAGASQNASQNNPPPVGTDFLSADAETANNDHEHENPLGRGNGTGRLGATYRAALNAINPSLGLGGY